MSEYEERKQGQQRAAAAPQTTYVPPLPIPDQAAIQLDLHQRAVQRYQQFFVTPAVAQRASAAPVLEAAQVQRAVALQRQQSQLALQRQIEALREGLPENALKAALQRQAEQSQVPALPPIFSGPTRSQPSYADHAQRYAHEAVSLQWQADQHSGFVSMSAWPTIQQRAAQDLAQRFRSDTSPATQRYAELGQSLALVQRQPNGKHVARVVLQRLPAGERPLVQRALDEAEGEHQQYGEQDLKALELHTLQRKLTEEASLAPQAMPRGSGQALPLAVQRQLEVGLNIPIEHLQAVRVHADPAAHSFAKSVNAIAATTGTNIFFQQGKLDTESVEGQELLAHEVTHTYQQAQGKVQGGGIDPDPGLEQEARDTGKTFARQAKTPEFMARFERKRQSVEARFQAGLHAPKTVQRLAAPTPEVTWYRDFVGNVAGISVALSLRRSGGKLHGRYQYHGQSAWLTVEGEVDPNTKAVTLTERDERGKVTGSFRGSFAGKGGETLSGTWTNAAGSKSHPFSFMLAEVHATPKAPAPQLPAPAPLSKWERTYGGILAGSALSLQLKGNGGQVDGQFTLGTLGTGSCAGQQNGDQLNLTLTYADGKNKGQSRTLALTLKGETELSGSWAGGDTSYALQLSTQAPRQTGKVSEAFLDAVLRELPAAMRHDPDKHGKLRIEKNLAKPHYREDARRILEACVRAGITDKAQIAYVLVTAAHESNFGLNMQELGGYSYFERLYGPNGSRPENAREHGNTQAGDGYKYRGRGFAQVTWKDNYVKWNERLTRAQYPLNGRLQDNPDQLSTNRDLAAKVIAEGMRDGVFTGAKLGTYINAQQQDFVQARRTINGLDHAEGMGKAASVLSERLNPLDLLAQEQESGQEEPKQASELGALIAKTAQEGVEAGWTEHIAYHCSKWTRQVVEHALGQKDMALSTSSTKVRGLFGGSALQTKAAFEQQGLTHPYTGVDDLQPGDILFWDVPKQYGHVAIYIGGGQVAGNHYKVYMDKRQTLLDLKQAMPGNPVNVGGLTVYDGIDARGLLPLAQVVSLKHPPILVARLPSRWTPRKK